MNIAQNLRLYQNTMFENISNYRLIADNLHTSAQPTIDELEKIKQAGVDVVINLARPDSPNAISNEAQLVEKNGMHYIHIPVDFENPTLTDLKQFFQAMDQYNDQTKLVHCACNYRASCFVYLYRIIKQNTGKALAEADMLSVWQPDDTWQTFIDCCLQKTNLLKK